ncbi:hypothetical protein FA95DRAFT_15399 [Auriscalpium vulgare]|uniref:Uncharacterized protein n=1 Tax=Auriscalpium vulgare TaxID=40419 RepID=A0ACB8SCE9_9AGAM|nr:hypothetical protein FA95DRAFT_15399 [Auriscalpium vulgare]
MPGSTIPLFQEDDIKILSAQVHPLDLDSTPYNFSSTDSPLLHNAARALNLPARSSQSYMSLFGHTTVSRYSSSSSSRSSSSRDSDVAPLDEHHTGHIVVSGYQVSFVLPKEFPPQIKVNGRPSYDSGLTPLPTKLRSRRGSIGDKNVILFMAGISMIVPYLSKPTRAPWLLSIPTPRCLSNHLKLRIFPPNSTPPISTSLQSLSSGEADSDNPTWDMTADPHVTRASNSSRRSAYQYQHFADDESSDSGSPGFSDGVGIQGSFPSTERIRVRWSLPSRSINGGTDDGRRRVGVASARSDMVCTILGRGRDRTGSKEGVLVRLQYEASCHGVWYPGVATLLGLDVGLEAKRCDISWARGHEAKWTAVGGTGFTGADINGQDVFRRGVQKQTSFEMPKLTISSSSPFANLATGHVPTRQSSSSSSSSLLRAPLPSSQVPEYSFESAPTTPSDTGMSSILSTDLDSRGRSRASSMDDAAATVQPASSPLTVHLNINDLLPPNKNTFKFSITGVVLVSPREKTPLQLASPEASEPEEGSPGLVVSLPRFRVLAADSEKIETTVRNGIDSALETVDLYHESSPRRHELGRGDRAKLGYEDGRIVLRTPPRMFRSASPLRIDADNVSRPASRPRTPDLQLIGATSALRDSFWTSLRPKRDGPLMIPHVEAKVTPLALPNSTQAGAYAVRVALHPPADTGSEWLHFGLGQPALPSNGAGRGTPRVDIASVTSESVPVKHELLNADTSDGDSIARVRVHTGPLGGGLVEIVYVVTDDQPPGDVAQQTGKSRGKARASALSEMCLVLPTFDLPIGKLQVDVESYQDYEIASVQSNMAYTRVVGSQWRVFDYNVCQPFRSKLSVFFGSKAAAPETRTSRTSQNLYVYVAMPILFLLSIALAYHMGTKVGAMQNGAAPSSEWDFVAPVFTVTPIIVSTVTPHGEPISSTSGAVPQASEPTPATIIDVSQPSGEPRPRSNARGGNVHFNEHFAVLDPRQWKIVFGMPFTRQQVISSLSSGFAQAWHFIKWAYNYPVPIANDHNETQPEDSP